MARGAVRNGAVRGVSRDSSCRVARDTKARCPHRGARARVTLVIRITPFPRLAPPRLYWGARHETPQMLELR
eukprot:scaffold47177_cov54-Phaeocystis_antarctica.AAC.2